jgi:hypothetical protein
MMCMIYISLGKRAQGTSHDGMTGSLAPSKVIDSGVEISYSDDMVNEQDLR